MANEAFRAIALTEANKLGLKSTSEVVTAAGAFLAFLIADQQTGAKQTTAPAAEPPPKAPVGTAPAKPAPATKPAKAEKAPPAKKLVPEKSEEEKAAEALAKAAAEENQADESEGEPEFDWSGEPGQKEVGKVVSALIAANKRPEAIKLLADYKAASVSGVKAADREQFVADGNSLFGDGADITA